MTSRLLKYLTVFILSVAFIFSPFRLNIARAGSEFDPKITDPKTGNTACNIRTVKNNTNLKEETVPGVWNSSDNKCYLDCSYAVQQFGLDCPGDWFCSTYDTGSYQCTGGVGPLGILATPNQRYTSGDRIYTLKPDATDCSKEGAVLVKAKADNKTQCVSCGSSEITSDRFTVYSTENGGCGSSQICKKTTNGRSYCADKVGSLSGAAASNEAIAAGKGIPLANIYEYDSSGKLATNPDGTPKVKCSFSSDNIGIFLGNNLVALISLLATQTLAGAIKGVPWVGGVASSTYDVLSNVIKNYIDALVIGTVISFGLMASGWLIEKGLEYNNNVARPDNAIIQSTFGFTLGLANITFVLALIAIGILTILRKGVGKESIAAVIIRLIIAILLVNFSIFIVRFLTQISDILTNAFVGSTCPAYTLVNRLGVWNTQGSIIQGGGTITKIILSPITIYISDGIAAVGLLISLVVAIYLFLRYFITSLLIIAMPIAWLGYIFPKMEITGIGNPWKYWWDNFTKWLIAGPMISFFLYLIPVYLEATAKNAALLNDKPFNILQTILNVIAIGILGVGGVVITNSLSGVGSKLLTTGATAALGFGMKAVGGLRQKAFGGLALKSEEKQKELDKAAQKGGWGARLAAGGFGALGTTIKGAGGFGTTTTTKMLKNVGFFGQTPKLTDKEKETFDKLEAKEAAGTITPKEVEQLKKLRDKQVNKNVPTVATMESLRKDFGQPSKFKYGSKSYDQLNKDEALAELARLEKGSLGPIQMREQKLAIMRKLAKEGALDKVDLEKVYGNNFDAEIKKYGIDFDKEFASSLGMNRASYDAKKKMDGAKEDVNGKQSKSDELNKQVTEQNSTLATAQSDHSGATTIITQAQGELAIAEQKLTDARVNNPRLVGTYKDQVLKIQDRISKAQTEQNDAQSTIDRIAASTIAQETQVADATLQSAIASSQAASNNFTAQLGSFYKSLNAESMKNLPINSLLGNFDANSPVLGTRSQTELSELRSHIESALVQNPTQMSAIATKVSGQNYDQFAMETANSALASVGAKTFTDPKALRDQLGRSSIIRNIKNKNQPLGEEIEKIFNNLP